MKKFAMLITVLAFAVPAPAAARHIPDDQGLVLHCRDIQGRFSETSFGECVAQNHTYYNDARGYAASLCNFYEENYTDEFYEEWDSFAECVQELRDVV